MRIEDVAVRPVPGGARLSATVRFEARPRPPLELCYDVDDPFSAALVPRSDPFLLVAVPYAAWHGEGRVRVEGTACSVLRANLEETLRVLTHWYPRCNVPRLEASAGFVASAPLVARRSGLLLSGGVDALAALHQNLLDVPRDHPDAIHDGILLFGMNRYDFADGVPVPERLARHEANAERLAAFGRRLGVTLVPVRTNVHRLHDAYEGWVDAGAGAGIVSVAHALGGRLTDVYLGSGGAGVEIPPHAFHPLLDDRHSSGAVRVRSAQPYTSRLEKVGRIAAWPEARSALLSCHHIDVVRPDLANCGRCEKCVRTMLELAAWGALEGATTYAASDLTPEAVLRIRIPPLLERFYGPDLVRGLAAHGRDDLAEAVRAMLRRLHETRWQRQVRKWRRSLARRLGRRRPRPQDA